MAYNPYNNQNTGTIQLLTDDYSLIVQSFRAFNSKFLQAKHIGAALRKTIAPGVKALRKTTPRGPTGNLKRAIDMKVRRYTNENNGWAIAIAGYRAAGKSKSSSVQGGRVRKGKDRGFHMGFVSFGTKPRTVKNRKNIASSWNSLGPFLIGFKIGRKKNKKSGLYKKFAKRMRFEAAQKVYTIPKAPKAFFKRGRAGQPVDLGRMPIGGKKGQSPLPAAFKMAGPAMNRLLPEEMKKSLEACRREAFGRYMKSGGRFKVY